MENLYDNVLDGILNCNSDNIVIALERIELVRKQGLDFLSLSGLLLDAWPTNIWKLTNLIKLDLSYNKFSKIPKEICQFPNLKEINLSGLLLDEWPENILELTNLIKLDLSNNKFSKIPKEICQFPNLKEINLNGNPLIEPPIEIANQGIDAIRSYFISLEVGEKQPLNEIKVILIGDGGAGKTSLLKRLIGEQFDKNESQTHGINIKNFHVNIRDETVYIHFWDFGGQEIMHATHNFFLSKRSLYILVLDGRKDEKTEYWLKHIESHGGDSPILVVLNKIDENPGFEVNRKFLSNKYKGIRNFHRISCAVNEGIETFRSDLYNELIRLEVIKTQWAKSWFYMKLKLEEMHEPYITYELYKEMCKKEYIGNENDIDTLAKFLNDLGIILHFDDIKLLDMYVLEPKWVTLAVYKIINSKILAENKGILYIEYLNEILKQEKDTDYYYSRDRYSFIIELMKKFELCYEIDDTTILIPDLLEVEEPQFEFEFINSLKFVVNYDFLPMSIMPRFMVKRHREIVNSLRWRTGVILYDKRFNAQALIKADTEDKKIYIYTNGELRRDYFASIISTLREINDSFEKLEYMEKVPILENPKVEVSYKHLIKLELKSVEKFIPEGANEEYSVTELLGTVHKKEELKQVIESLVNENRIDFNIYQNYGTLVGTMGNNSNIQRIENIEFLTLINEVDTKLLLQELKKLIKKMRRTAETVEEFNKIAEVAKAEAALKEGKKEKVYHALKSAGEWALNAATDIGTNVLADLIKSIRY